MAVCEFAALLLVAQAVSGQAIAQDLAPPVEAPTEATAEAAAPEAVPVPVPSPGNAAIEGVIRNIVVQGTQRVEPDSVLSYMSLRPGVPYDPVAADESLKVLFETGLFADVGINWDGQTLFVRVVENPILNQIVFEGNDTISDEDLTREAQVRPRMVFTRARVQADVQRIIELYRRSGHFAAVVEPKIIQRP